MDKGGGGGHTACACTPPGPALAVAPYQGGADPLGLDADIPPLPKAPWGWGVPGGGFREGRWDGV